MLICFCGCAIWHEYSQVLMIKLMNWRPHTHLLRFILVNEKTFIFLM